MKLTILDSKSGEKTAKIDDIFIHSNYAPIKETKKFCENIQLSINPKVIIVVEPGLSYLYSELKTRLPVKKGQPCFSRSTRQGATPAWRCEAPRPLRHPRD